MRPVTTSMASARAAAPSPPPRHEGDDLAALLEPLRVKHDLPALGGAIVTDEKIEALGVTGVRKYGKKKLATIDDPFHLGSDGKAMTAVVIGKAVDAGKLTWQTTVGQAFADLPMNAAYKNVTLEDLLAMRGGFPHDPKSITALELKLLDGPLRAQRDTYLRKALLDAPEIPPKTKMSYSNVSYVLAAAMAERAMNASWEDMIANEVWAPLGMQGAGFGAMGTPKKIDAPWQHVRDEDGITPIEPGPKSDNPIAMCPSGCAHMPIGAWALFVRDQLRSFDGKGELLKPETYEYLHSAHTDDKYFAGWQMLERPWGKGIVYTHSGSNTMNFALAWMAPKIRRAFLVTTNVADRDNKTFEACDDVIGALIQWDKEHAPQ